MTSLLEHFRNSKIQPLIREGSLITYSSKTDTYKTSSFYLDSTGRSSVPLTIQLSLSSQEAINQILAANCLHPPPDKAVSGEVAQEIKQEDPSVGGEENGHVASNDITSYFVGVEAKVTLTVGSGEAVSAQVEAVQILSTRLERFSIILETAIFIRVNTKSNDFTKAKSNIEVSVVLTETTQRCDTTDNDETLSIASDLRHIQLGALAEFTGNLHSLGLGKNERTRILHRLAPIALSVQLNHAFFISARTSCIKLGETLVALTLEHANTHPEPITITNIALHPGHSIQIEQHRKESTMNNEKFVQDMTKTIRWGYLPLCDPRLPLTLKPHETYSTILKIEADHDIECRSFSSPLSVTALVGRNETETEQQHRYSIRAATNIQWTTTHSVVNDGDVFQVEIKQEEQTYAVGEILSLPVQVSNVSPLTRRLVLVVQDNEIERKQVSDKVVQAPTVVQDQAAGSHVLLAIDKTCRLGEIRPHCSAKVQLRFIPLQPGVIRVPSFSLLDQDSNKIYSCFHNARVVAR